jgi:hypothetical protein
MDIPAACCAFLCLQLQDEELPHRGLRAEITINRGNLTHFILSKTPQTHEQCLRLSSGPACHGSTSRVCGFGF